MVLGLKTKNRRDSAVQVHYLIHIQEIKPWPPSQSLKSLRSVMIQWENGERSSGSTIYVVPSIGSVIGEGRIEFNESFRLSAYLSREMSIKGRDSNTFQKNFLEFNLYEPRRDKTVKGQLLGTAIIDLAEYGVVKETLSISTPVNCKRNFRNTAQPILFIKIQPVKKGPNNSLSREGSISREMSMDRNRTESVSALMKEEYAEEAELASFTDDDVSSQYSSTVASPVPDSMETPQEITPSVNESAVINIKENAFPLASSIKPSNKMDLTEAQENQTNALSFTSSVDLSSDAGSPMSDPNSSTKFCESSAAEIYAEGHTFPLASGIEESDGLELTVGHERQKGSLSCTTSGASRSTYSPNSFRKSTEPSASSVSSAIVSPNVQFSSSSNKIIMEERNDQRDQDVDRVVSRGNGTKINVQSSTMDNSSNAISDNIVASKSDLEMDAILPTASSLIFHTIRENDGKFSAPSKIGLDEDATVDDIHMNVGNEDATVDDIHMNVGNEDATVHDIHMNVGNDDNLQEHAEERRIEVEGRQFEEEGRMNGSDLYASTKKFEARSSSHSSYLTAVTGMKSQTNDRLRHVKSVRSSADTGKGNGSIGNCQLLEGLNEAKGLGDTQTGIKLLNSEKRDSRIQIKDKSTYSNNRIEKLEHRIKMLEGELREAAAVEAALYAVVAEHGSSTSKVHAPARRLSRLYLHTFKENSSVRKASAARTSVSGLVLVGKACGNDVPRLTFWLSNSIILRTIISQSMGDPEITFCGGQFLEKSASSNINKERSLNWKKSFPGVTENDNTVFDNNGNWEDPRTFVSALEKVEAWIFLRIVESVWWQSLTPCMQPAAANAINKSTDSNPKETYTRMPSLDEQDQSKFSLDLWKEAFKEACKRLCPVRAEGHECGCLPVLARMIMEECIARLDVAMFNAILRESDDEIPTDPVSDPISDLRVIPILAGKTSFGAGAQLKNAIGNWSRWLRDLFGMDDDESLDEGDEDERRDTSSKSFSYLSALSDLMMLPKDMLLNRSIRKEVCPKFGAPLIKRILDNFVPDEFCPDPVPKDVIEALECEDDLEVSDDHGTNFPCTANAPTYVPPSAASLSHITGQAGNPQLRRSGSSLLRKSYNSDDELDELDSPLTSIFMDRLRSTSLLPKPSRASKQNDNQNAVRYQLLREVWMNCS